MRVRQFKIRVNQGSFLKNSIKDWTSNWITTNKTLSRSCLHADINLNKIVQSQGDKVSAQFGAIHISFFFRANDWRAMASLAEPIWAQKYTSKPTNTPETKKN